VSEKVLVVDDESHILRVISLKLTHAGYQVLTAMDGEEALEIIEAEHPSAVITDYQMPYVSGLEVCRKLHESDRTHGTPTILLTARGFDIEPQKIINAGISAVLAKPFSPREVIEKVNELLGKRTAGKTT
jgi:CheY-like chemotaxis protein